MMGTLPTGLTVTDRPPAERALPSETVTETVLMPVLTPPSEYTRVPSGVKLTASGAVTDASVTYIGSPSGSSQSPRICVVTLPPWTTVVLLVWTCTGALFSPGVRTMTFTLAVAVPPLPSLIV